MSSPCGGPAEKAIRPVRVERSMAPVAGGGAVEWDSGPAPGSPADLLGGVPELVHPARSSTPIDRSGRRRRVGRPRTLSLFRTLHMSRVRPRGLARLRTGTYRVIRRHAGQRGVVRSPRIG